MRLRAETAYRWEDVIDGYAVCARSWSADDRCGAAVGVLIAGASPGLPIPAAAFGQHRWNLGGAPADVELRSVRLWDTGTRWDEIETAPDQYTWDTLDAAVDSARAGGATDVLYVLGSTPQMGGPGSRSRSVRTGHHVDLPKDTEDYVDFVREVANRYKGRITAYQIWNEANTRSFYEGDWTALAKLTRRAHDAIKLIDRRRRWSARPAR